MVPKKINWGGIMQSEYRNLIADEFLNCVENTIKRLEQEETHRPFHSALLSHEAMVWSRFERSFSTSFGQRVIEKISYIAAFAGGASEAKNQKETIVSIDSSKLQAIENHIMAIRQNKLGRNPSWENDLYEISKVPNMGIIENVRVISDLWWVKNGVENFISIKTVKPNIDQTAEAKRDLLKLKISNPDSNVYFGMYYNPFGEEREDYNWYPPKGVFDFTTDSVVLIGRDYWDVIGGYGFYDELIEIANEVGQITREKLSRLY